MQQPYLMGTKAGDAMISAIGGTAPEKEISVPILAVTSENVEQELPTIEKTVFGGEM